MVAAALNRFPSGKPLILLALSYADEQEMYDAQLRFDGFHTVVASDAGDLVAKARALRPHAIVVCQHLAGGGEAACEQLKGDRHTCHIPLILLVSYTTSRIKSPEAVLTRPVLPPVLGDQLNVVIGTSETTDAGSTNDDAS